MKRFNELSALVAGVCLVGMSVMTAAQEGPSSSPAARQEPSAGRVGGDGITVHGHWTIDVHNADGTVASHNEFENALETSGAAALANVLGRQAQAAQWRLDLIGQNGAGACQQTSGGSSQESMVVFGLSPTTFVGDPPVFTVGGTYNAYAPSLFAGAPIANFPIDPAKQTQFTLNAMDSPIVGGGLTLTLSGGIAWGDIQDNGAGSWVVTIDVTNNVAAGIYHGQITLADPLNHANVYDVFTVVGSSTQGTASPYPCSAVEPGSGIPVAFVDAWFPTLTLAVVDAVGGRQNLELTGNVRATTPEAIEQVRSVIILNTSATLPFSSRVLMTPIQVAAGQTIYVKVVLSFS